MKYVSVILLDLLYMYHTDNKNVNILCYVLFILMLKRVILSSMVGNFLEWCDFALFSAFAPIIGKTFYPSLSEISQLLHTFAIYAVGFITRPLGGIFFGYIGIKKGKKYALSLSIVMMAIPTTIIGFLPGYNQIGNAAPIILTILRLVQGFSMGGEFTSSMVFVVEHSKRFKHFLGSFAPASLALGVAFGSIMADVIYMLPKSFVETFGWRIPFIMSIFGGMLGVWMRKSLSEPSTDNSSNEEINIYRSCIYVIAIDMLVAVGFFIISAGLIGYLKAFMNHSISISSLSITYALLVMAVSMPISGIICDIIRGHRFIMSSACIAMIVMSFKVMPNMKEMPYSSCMILGMIMGIYFAPVPVVLCSLFPQKIRILGISMMHNLSMTIFGGTMPFLMTHTLSVVSSTTFVPAIFLSIAASISLLGIIFYKKNR